ncbi:hypothetical protein AVEN_149667-1 [Araneus ventricosus]|uniref:PiggyBac transposable element-derived protein domain-containing protein n=1 Tax=Araneus ventricosus TaxID=182803 RepID=A0A4Y2WG64_ARAVE|nr:hypothetical protein AVEN_149667-1 [Araneus ventricosus]
MPGVTGEGGCRKHKEPCLLFFCLTYGVSNDSNKDTISDECGLWTRVFHAKWKTKKFYRIQPKDLLVLLTYTIAVRSSFRRNFSFLHDMEKNRFVQHIDIGRIDLLLFIDSLNSKPGSTKAQFSSAYRRQKI